MEPLPSRRQQCMGTLAPNVSVQPVRKDQEPFALAEHDSLFVACGDLTVHYKEALPQVSSARLVGGRTSRSPRRFWLGGLGLLGAEGCTACFPVCACWPAAAGLLGWFKRHGWQESGEDNRSRKGLA